MLNWSPPAFDPARNSAAACFAEGDFGEIEPLWVNSIRMLVGEF